MTYFSFAYCPYFVLYVLFFFLQYHEIDLENVELEEVDDSGTQASIDRLKREEEESPKSGKFFGSRVGVVMEKLRESGVGSEIIWEKLSLERFMTCSVGRRKCNKLTKVEQKRFKKVRYIIL